MTFAEQIIYNRMIQQVVHKGGESAIKYIKIFHNDKALAISVGNNYTEDHLMHIFLNNFRKGGKHSAQIRSHQAELGIEEKLIDKK